MDKLTECRMKIDEIDSQIIELFEARMDVVKEVTSYKINNNKPVLDSSREAIMLDKNLKKIKNEEYKKRTSKIDSQTEMTQMFEEVSKKENATSKASPNQII